MLRGAEVALAWSGAAAGAAAVALGVAAPRLGGGEPGLPGTLGFAAEAAAAMWLQCGALALVAAALAWPRRLRAPAVAFAMLAFVVLAPEAWRRLGAPGERLAAAVAGGRDAVLRVATANLAEQNTDDPDMVHVLRALDADVLVLPELTRSWEERLAPLAAEYPHRFVAEPPSAGEWPLRRDVVVEGLRIGVWSRLPPDGAPRTLRLDGYVPQLRVPLRWNGESVAVYGVHPGKPWPRSIYDRAFRHRRELVAWLRAETGAAIVAGDCNAPPRGAVLQRLREAGWTNASEAVLGHAPTTWPMVPPLLWPFRTAIDHVLCTAAFEPVGFERVTASRSDHAAVVATFARRGPH